MVSTHIHETIGKKNLIYSERRSIISSARDEVMIISEAAQKKTLYGDGNVPYLDCHATYIGVKLVKTHQEVYLI